MKTNFDILHLDLRYVNWMDAPDVNKVEDTWLKF